MYVTHACRWQNPLIGWTSTGDPMEHVARSALNFHSKEEAVAFAEKQGFTPVVREPQRRRPDRLKRYAGYGDNFRCSRVTELPQPTLLWELLRHGHLYCTSMLASSMPAALRTCAPTHGPMCKLVNC
jgi:ETC complex I subunit conserved region